MKPYILVKMKPLVSRLHPTCCSSLPSLCYTGGTIKVILLSPPGSPLRDLPNSIHWHLICDREYHGPGTGRHRAVLLRSVVDRPNTSLERGVDRRYRPYMVNYNFTFYWALLFLWATWMGLLQFFSINSSIGPLATEICKSLNEPT